MVARSINRFIDKYYVGINRLHGIAALLILLANTLINAVQMGLGNALYSLGMSTAMFFVIARCYYREVLWKDLDRAQAERKKQMDRNAS